MRRTFEFVSSAETQATLLKVITFLYQRTSSSRSTRPRESGPDGCSLPLWSSELPPSTCVCALVCVGRVICLAYCLSTPLAVGGGAPQCREQKPCRASKLQQRGGGEGCRDSSRVLLIWGQQWRSVLFIHVFIEKMSILWFGSSQDWFV